MSNDPPDNNLVVTTSKIEALLAPPDEADLDEEDIEDETVYPARPDVVQYVNVPKTHINHTYRNFSNMPMDHSYVMPSIIDDMTFHEKLYSILSSATKTTREAINWCHHGRAFVINDATKLNRYGILAHFGYNKVQRFRKDLCARGYKRLGPSNAEPEYFYSEVTAVPMVCRFAC